MIKLENFINEKTLKPFIEERRDAYEEKAIGFLRKQFTPAVALLSDEQLREVVRLAYKNARKRRILSERENLKYLIPVMFWGSHFETDPQYRDALCRAGWVNELGQPLIHPYVTPVLEELDHWFLFVKSDLENPKKIISGFVNIYKTAHSKPPVSIIQDHMHSVWPARTKIISVSSQLALIEIASAISETLNLVGNDLILYVNLTQYFGHKCAFDPIYPWINAALLNDGRDPKERRLTLEEGVLKYWDGLLENT